MLPDRYRISSYGKVDRDIAPRGEQAKVRRHSPIGVIML